ncbi:MAG: hypothetical protein MMC23_006335 [Stictis urceolatum]|nr:hypothetical protein [Stictis urceolata]
MTPRLPLTRFARLSNNSFSYSKPSYVRVASRRHISSDEKPLPKNDKPGPGPNQEQLPHVSEEAAAISKTKGEQAPELEQGTPVQDILQRDPSSKDTAPEVLKDKNKSYAPNGSRSYSTSARKQMELSHYPPANESMDPHFDLSSMSSALDMAENKQHALEETTGHTFGLPGLPIGSRDHLKYRYDPVVQQVTMLLMKDGKLARAQSNMARILNQLRTSPAPNTSLKYPLVPGAPPPAHLPLNPVLYLQTAIDSVAPLMRLRSLKGFAGGGQALQVPQPLAVRQRRRTAVMWILDAIGKKTSKGSGKGMFAQKFADEIIAIVEGKSSVWEKRGSTHKLGVAARSNLAKVEKGRR